MFAKVLTTATPAVIRRLAPRLEGFYLAGGTGLALQLGHRKSDDLDFFSLERFQGEALKEKLSLQKALFSREGTLHGQIGACKLTFLYYPEPLAYPLIHWRGMAIADWRDICAEKFKVVSQRGSKKDFYDLYALLKSKASIAEACGCFKKRFAARGMNMYHILKSLVYFDDAEAEPSPILFKKGSGWAWKDVKTFFIQSIREFEKELL